VLSRCLQFNLKQMTPTAISGHLKHILEAEGISAEPGALNLLSRSAAGSMRDALSLLDQAIAHGSGKVEETQVRDMLGTVDLDYLFSILDALLAGDASGMLAVADDMATRSLSFDAALQELASLLTRLQVAQLAPQAVADDLPERVRLLDLAARLDPEFVQLAYQIAVHGRKELPLAPDDLSGFIMTLLRLHAFRPAAASGAAPRVVASRPNSGATERQSAPLVKTPVASYRVAEAPPAESIDGDVVARKAGAIKPAAPAPVPAIAESDWHAILAALKLGGMARELAQHCELRSMDGVQLVLRLSPTHRHLQMKPAQDKLQQSLSEHFGRPLQVRIELAEVESATPAATAQRDRRELQDRAVAAIEQDGFVREVIEMFDATLIESSIKPV
jgi:DNA polymerase-3 subunit gamma/tau